MCKGKSPNIFEKIIINGNVTSLRLGKCLLERIPKKLGIINIFIVIFTIRTKGINDILFDYRNLKKFLYCREYNVSMNHEKIELFDVLRRGQM